MYNFLVKNGTALAMGVGTLVTLIFIITVMLGFKSAGYDTSTDLMQVDYKSFNGFNVGLYLTVALTVLALIAMLVAVVFDLGSNYKTSGKMIIGVVALIILFFILYSTATYDTGGKWDELNKDFNVGPGASKFISAGIWTTGILILISIGAMVVAEVRNFFK